ncbi:MAG: M50 family metallopeptidase [Actinobacteria bacterium]|nr:M50 family metallopeptidase [Actinomycetota bacterium]
MSTRERKRRYASQAGDGKTQGDLALKDPMSSNGAPIDPDKAARQVGLLRLLVGLVLGLGVAAALGALGGVLVILAVLMMIVLHEFGHFATAKLTGMKVTEFFVGFGPRLWSVRMGETEYGVKVLPLGGYCKIPGMTNLEEIDPADEARTYRQQRFWKRFLVAVAGSATHFILAFLLLYGGLLSGAIFPINAEPLATVAELTDLPIDGPSPAERAGFQVGDRIVAVDGDLVAGWEEVRSYTLAHPGEEIEFLVERDGTRATLTATPIDGRRVVVDGEPVAPPDGPAVGLVGIAPAWETYGVVAAAPAAAAEVGVVTGETLKALKQLVMPSGVSRYIDQLQGDETELGDPRFLSPVGLARVAGTAAESGIGTVLFLLIAINIFVGIFNMLPLLPLDGGHVLIAVYEGIRSRPGRRYHADVSKLQPVLIFTFLLLAALFITALYLDIVRPLQFQ